MGDGVGAASATVEAAQNVKTVTQEPESSAKPKACAIALLVLILALLVPGGYVGRLLYFFVMPLYFFHDILLGWLVGWAIARTPKPFIWTIERVSLKPSFSWHPDVWTEVVLTNWTWHNPPEFGDDERSFLLKIDRLTLRVDLASIYVAIRHQKAIIVDFLFIEGMKIMTRRNRSGAVNLWAILDLQDEDVNVNTILTNVRTHGGMNAGNGLDATSPLNFDSNGSADNDANNVQTFKLVDAVPAKEEDKPAQLWRPEWGKRPDKQTVARWMWAGASSNMSVWNSLAKRNPFRWSDFMTISQVCKELKDYSDKPNRVRLMICGRDSPDLEIKYENADVAVATLAWLISGGDSPPPKKAAPPLSCKASETADTRERPVWGVPMRFDIRQLLLLRSELWIFDMLTMDAHSTRQDLTDESDSTGIHLESINLTRERLEQGDIRRAGEGDDGVRGVYLGEIVLAIVGEALPAIIKGSPSGLLQNLLYASAYGAKDASVRMGAKAFEIAHNTKHGVVSGLSGTLFGSSGKKWADNECRVKVNLMEGRHMTNKKGHSVNVHAILQLLDSPQSNKPNAVLDEAKSSMKMWTNAPSWQQLFELGPVSFAKSTVRIACYHRRTMRVLHLEDDDGEDDRAAFIGEVIVPLSALLSSDVGGTGGDSNEKVGWFTLGDPTALQGQPRGSGQVKLGLQLINHKNLPDKSEEESSSPAMPSLSNFLGDPVVNAKREAADAKHESTMSPVGQSKRESSISPVAQGAELKQRRNARTSAPNENVADVATSFGLHAGAGLC